jgi:hypothetical protein
LLTDIAATSKRFFARGDEKLTAFMALEAAIRGCGELPRHAGENFPKLAGYENKYSTNLNHICTRLFCTFARSAGG